LSFESVRLRFHASESRAVLVLLEPLKFLDEIQLELRA